MVRLRYDRVLTLGYIVTPAGALSPTLRLRVDRAIEHYRAGRTQTLVMSGGQTEPEPCTTASAMKAHAVGQGIRASDIIEQGDALDTVGEAIFSRLLAPMPNEGPLLIVTSAFHADRAERIFRFVYGAKIDLAVEGAPNGPDDETPSAALEAASLERFNRLFRGIDAGDLDAILARFWQDHALYQGAEHAELHQRTLSALAALNPRGQRR